MSARFDHLGVGVTYRPSATGAYMWQEFRAVTVANDLVRIRRAGFETVRVHLAWDAFMPTHRQVDRRRIAELETLLEAARAASLRVVLVLFAQADGDCLQLPAYAVDRRGARPGVRVIADTRIQIGGPRDLYVDPLMLEAETLWLDTLLDAFANHPAIASWDLGEDPARVMRPRRTGHLAAWVELMASRIRAREDLCLLTLGQDDLVLARGVRLAAVSPHVDALGLLLEPQRLSAPLTDDVRDTATIAMLAQLGQRLSATSDRAAPPLLVVTGLASGEEDAPPAAPDTGEDSPPAWEVELVSPPDAARHAADLADRLSAVGVAGMTSTAWCDLGARALVAPPCDRRPSLARHGLAGTTGELKPVGEVWSRLARRELSLQRPDPWPEVLDVEDYYANLPESLLDLASRWRRERSSG